jgi:glycyl-tRNA synthetase alpha subunit
VSERARRIQRVRALAVRIAQAYEQALTAGAQEVSPGTR